MKLFRIIWVVIALVGLLLSRESFASPTTLMAKKLHDLMELREQVTGLKKEFSSIVESSGLRDNINAVVAIIGIERVELYLRELESSADVFAYVKDNCKAAYFAIKIFPLSNSKEYLDSQMESIEKGFEIEGALELVPLINRARVMVQSSKTLCREMIELLRYRVMDYKEAIPGDCNLSY